MSFHKVNLTVDIVLLKRSISGGEILLIQRGKAPFQGNWALPGGFVDENEDLEDAARRELREETNVHIQHLEQLKAFGKPFRDPRGHTVSIAFLAEVTDENLAFEAADDAADARWFPVNQLPTLAFDHREIIAFALSK